MTRGLTGPLKDFGFPAQCSGQPLKGLNGDSDVVRWSSPPSLSGLGLEGRWAEGRGQDVRGEAFEETTAIHMLSLATLSF